MSTFKRVVLTHGGSSSRLKESDGPQSAAAEGMDLMVNGKSALDAAVHAVKYLEDDPRFNAGTGSKIRIDGSTIQMDASCMDSDGKFGAVACVEGIQNPVELAHRVLIHSPHILLAGDGAKIFAQEQHIPIISSSTDKKRNTHEDDITPSCDTVGAVAFDGKIFAAALSSGGISKSAIGRVGDVPLPGCGLHCGSIGAVACTGDGEYIALKILAREVYSWLEKKMDPDEAAKKAIALFDDYVDIGLIVITKDGYAANARNDMAWSHCTEMK